MIPGCFEYEYRFTEYEYEYSSLTSAFEAHHHDSGSRKTLLSDSPTSPANGGTWYWLDGPAVAVGERQRGRDNAKTCKHRPEAADARADGQTRHLSAHGGSPSQLELFEHKPDLKKLHMQDCPASFLEGKRFAFIKGVPKILAGQFSFRQYGESGQWISELLPHFASVV